MDIKKPMESLKNILTDTGALVGEGYEEATSLLKDTFSKFSDVKTLTKDKLAGLTNDLLALIPLIEKTGYRTKEVEVGVSVPPRIIFHFEKYADISTEDIAAILQENTDKTLFKVIINTLLTADQFQQKLSLGKLKFSEIAIEMGVPPEVNIKLINVS